jgi:hypothetical protein
VEGRRRGAFEAEVGWQEILGRSTRVVAVLLLRDGSFCLFELCRLTAERLERMLLSRRSMVSSRATPESSLFISSPSYLGSNTSPSGCPLTLATALHQVEFDTLLNVLARLLHPISILDEGRPAGR